MTREKAIKMLEYIRCTGNGESEYMGCAQSIAIDMAIKALEQEPKAVLYSGDGYADGYMVYDMAECPSCGYKYEDGDKDWEEPFCPHCGQPLKWESEG